MNVGTIAVIGSILAGLVSLPAMSASITGDITAAGAELSGMSEQGFEETPRTVSETVTADSMQKTVETAFGRVTFASASDSFRAELESAQEALDVEREADVETVNFTTESAEIVVVETPERVEKVCTTPNGIVETVREGGGETVKFSGTDREHVRETCEDATGSMEAQLERLRGLSVNLGLVLPDVEIETVNASEESVVIRNAGGNDIGLDGWTLSDGDNTFSGFTGVVLAPGDTVTVYSEQTLTSEDCEESEGPDHELCWDSSFVWNDGGETATLTNAEGETVDTHTYD